MNRRIFFLTLLSFFCAGIAVQLGAQGMMGRGMMAPGYFGMPGWWDYPPPGDVEPLNIDQAAKAVEGYLRDLRNPDLELAEIMEFDNHFYAEVEEKSTGSHAFELLVNRYTGAIFPEPGPNMMWNTKYGHMRGGMMGGRMMGGWMMGPFGWGGPRGAWNRPDPDNKLRVSPKKARQIAQKFLDTYLPGTKAADEVDTFYGYYTIHVLKDGEVFGMLGVNGYRGWVWYHEWHGRFLGMKEMEKA